MEDGCYHNHFTVVLTNLIVSGLIIAMLVFFNMSDIVAMAGYGSTALVLAPIILILAIAYVRLWQKTTFLFTDSEIIVSVDMVSKKTKRIQYTRLASVNVRRNIFNVIFGTSTLMFNVNSSVDSNRAEATLCLKKEEADSLREELSRRIFDKNMSLQEDFGLDSLITVSNREIILHGLLAQSTPSTAFGIVMFAYSIYCLFFDRSGGFITGLLLMTISTLVPWIISVIKYYNYRIYRVDDTITVESGLISTYRSSFKVSKVNSIRIREPLIARLMGLSALEAEVVGMANNSGMPLLCPMKPCLVVDGLVEAILPEFAIDADMVRQPRKALWVMTIPLLVFIVTYPILALYCVDMMVRPMTEGAAYVQTTLMLLLTILFCIIAVLSVIQVLMAQKHRGVGFGDSLFIFIYGGLDLYTEIIRFDKVQMIDVSSGPIARMFGVVRCTVNMISSIGARKISSGLFYSHDLEKIGDVVMARIVDGRYDYRECM